MFFQGAFCVQMNVACQSHHLHLITLVIMQLIATLLSVFTSHFLHRSQYSPWPLFTDIIGLTKHCCRLFSGVNVKTGELFPATFPDKGPDQALRSARHLTGGQQVMFLLIILDYPEEGSL